MDTIYTDYENYLIGNSKDVGKHNFYGAAPGGANQQRALLLLHYALEEVLGWNEEEVIRKFDSYMINVLKLERVVDYIKYPAEVPDRDPRYILSLLYPERIKLNYTQMVVEVYQRVLRGEGQFPREYFAGVDGFFRFSICLQYLISSYKPFFDLDELYEFFLSPEGNKFLMKFRLKVPAEQFHIKLLDCIKEITANNEYCNLYYSYYSFYVELTGNTQPMFAL